ncbi:hypothetical protein BJV82DRAFT_662442 [Fennellomyces sp. T-0311]|nr:hypothetical protein BJV82DRAFT_662442 [Fennellomyces sp. T-0311]
MYVATQPRLPDPPESHWVRINETAAKEWRIYLKLRESRWHVCVKTIKYGAGSLVQQHVTYLTNEAEQHKVLLQGYKLAQLRRMYPRDVPGTPTYQPPDCAFVSAAKRIMSEEKFMEEFLASRQYALGYVESTMYVKANRSVPSFEMAAFIDERNKYDLL